MKKYELEIYEPESKSDVLVSFESTTPFMGISKGEVLNPAFFSAYNKNPEKVLKVTQVEHVLWQHEGQEEPKQKILIFTQELDNNSESRN